MSTKIIPAAVWVWIVVALALSPLCATLAQAAGSKMKVEAQLIWATNDAKSPNPKHKPVDADTLKKLQGLPLKWSNYFQVNKIMVELPQGELKKASLSEKCELEMKNLDSTKVEVTHFGKGKKVGTRIQALPKGEMLVLGGNAPNSTAWFVVLKRLE